MLNQADLIKKIEALAGAEKVTRTVLGELSRDMIQYIVIDDTNDIATVNRLLQVLTPANKRTAIEFFEEFLPFKQAAGVFSKKIKGDKKIADKVEAGALFLEVEANTVWTWYEAEGVKPPVKAKEYAKKIADLTKKALADDQEGIEGGAILSAVLEGGVSLADLVLLMEQLAIKEAA